MARPPHLSAPIYGLPNPLGCIPVLIGISFLGYWFNNHIDDFWFLFPEGFNLYENNRILFGIIQLLKIIFPIIIYKTIKRFNQKYFKYMSPLGRIFLYTSGIIILIAEFNCSFATLQNYDKWFYPIILLLLSILLFVIVGLIKTKIGKLSRREYLTTKKKVSRFYNRNNFIVRFLLFSHLFILFIPVILYYDVVYNNSDLYRWLNENVFFLWGKEDKIDSLKFFWQKFLWQDAVYPYYIVLILQFIFQFFITARFIKNGLNDIKNEDLVYVSQNEELIPIKENLKNELRILETRKDDLTAELNGVNYKLSSINKKIKEIDDLIQKNEKISKSK